MNSGRTKYSFTPTYGMQRRGFGKKQTEKKIDPELDFLQKPSPDFDVPVHNASDPYMMPQGIFHDPVPQQAGGAFPANGMQNQPVGAMQPGYAIPVQTMPPQSGMPQYAPPLGSAYGETGQPFTGAPLPQLPPLANTAPAVQQPAVNARAQGYVPPVVRHAEPAPLSTQQPASIPQATAYQPMAQPAFMQQQPVSAQPLYAASPAGPGMTTGFAGSSQPPAQPPQKKGRQPINIDNWLKMLLYIILPVSFVLCIALPSEFNILSYLFMTVCAASVGMLWYRQSFSPSLRTGITIGYGLMCVVLIAVMLTGPGADLVRGAPNITAQPTPTITVEPEALSYAADQAPVTTPPAEIAPADTDAGQRLSAFMDNWKVNRVEDMLNYVMPSWRQAQTNAAAALFTVLSNRTPLEYEIESISGGSGDTSRSLTMSATIDKNNGNDPVRYRFVILMDKEDSDWYVDPNSLSTNDIAQTEETIAPDNLDAIFTMAPRMTVTPVPPASTLLYYNANGGKYYHADPECPSVNEKYLPMASFTYGELGNEPYRSLLPCLKCNAPTN